MYCSADKVKLKTDSSVEWDGGDYWLSTSEEDGLVFSVQACPPAHLILSDVFGVLSHNALDIYIGDQTMKITNLTSGEVSNTLKVYIRNNSIS